MPAESAPHTVLHRVAAWGPLLFGLSLIGGGPPPRQEAASPPALPSSPPDFQQSSPDFHLVSFSSVVARPPLYGSPEDLRAEIRKAELSAEEYCGPFAPMVTKPILDRVMQKDGRGADLVDDLFRFIDSDGDGVVSRAEFIEFREDVSARLGDRPALLEYIRLRSTDATITARLIRFVEDYNGAIALLRSMRQ